MAKLTVVTLLTLLHCVISFKETWSAGKHKTDSALNFLVVGDWGGQTKHPYTTPAEVDLAKVMGKRAKKINSQFTLALGDNFYDSGVKDVEDKRFKETFEVSFLQNLFTMAMVPYLSNRLIMVLPWQRHYTRDPSFSPNPFAAGCFHS